MDAAKMQPCALRYSKQRELIREHLCSRSDHPTAEQIYLALRQGQPHLSLATVYRNLAQLEQQGVVVRVSAGTAKEHYDGNILPHYHLSCAQCGGVSDVFLEVDHTVLARAEKATGGTVHSHSLIFHGVCSKCKE